MLRFDLPAARLRSVGFIEGVSYLLLLFVAMPLKYFAGMPMAVRIVGLLHGLLFVWLALLTARPFLAGQRSFAWAARIGAASLIPFAMFFIDPSLREEERAEREQTMIEG